MKEQSKGLVKRGLWLILLEVTFVNFAIWFDVQYRLLLLQVIAAIGAGFLVMSFLLRVPTKVLGIAAGIILLTHDLVRLIPQTGVLWLDSLKSVLFTAGLLEVSPDFTILVGYPLVPWAALMILGYSMGRIFESQTPDQGKRITVIGGAFILVFVIVRLTNLYVDPSPWKIEKNTVFTILSFINVTKYPPSVLFVLLFLGLAFLVLQLLKSLPAKVGTILSTCGRVPLFYYLLHFYLIRLSVFIVAFAQGFQWNDLLFGPFQQGRPASGFGLDLGELLLVWLLLVLVLYPFCVWFARYKEANRHRWWLRYL